MTPGAMGPCRVGVGVVQGGDLDHPARRCGAPWAIQQARSIAVTRAPDCRFQLIESDPGIRIGLAQREGSTGLRLIGKNVLLIGTDVIKTPDQFLLKVFEMMGESQSPSLLA